MKIIKYWVTFDIFVIFVIVAISSVGCNTVSFTGEIAENRTISECINGYKSSLKIRDPEMYITTSQYARKQGYPAEEHVVMTEDGYILTIHRIPGAAGAPPVFLQHPLTASSFEWVGTGRQQSLAFKLADAGYDVWLGNARGTTYSRCHTKYKTSSFEFWDFSWHEIGIYDLPVMIMYVTNATSQQVIYIGHSMGTTEFFVMASEKPDIASKEVKLMMALAPMVYLDIATSSLFTLAPLASLFQYYIKFTGTGEFLTNSPAWKILLKYACMLTMSQRKFCVGLASFILGFDSHQFNYTLAPDLISHYPEGTSVRCFIHYNQVHDSGRFQHYDYGAENNLKLYNSIEPPIYNISKITVPIGLFLADSDIYANPIDVMRLYKELPNAIPPYHIEDPNFNHADYLSRVDAPKLVYERVLTLIKNYT